MITLSQDESIKTCGSFNPPHNYKCMDLSVTLHCTPTEVKQPTCRVDSRLEVLHKLDWVNKLNVESLVYGTIPTIAIPVQESNLLECYM